MKLAHANQTEISEVGVAIGIPVRQRRELRKVIAAVERQGDEPLPDHREHKGDAPEVKRSLRKDRLAGQEGLGDPLRDANRPFVVTIVTIRECDEESGVGNARHEREKPLRAERSRGPRTAPAKRMNDCWPLLTLAFSSWSRMIFPWGTPVLAATCSSQTASSLLRSYPDIDGLFREQAAEVDRKKRETILHRIQQLMHEKAMFAPIWQLTALHGVGFRVADSGLGLITEYPFSAPYDDVKLKGK